MEWDRSRIRALRAALRLTREEFAHQLGAAPKTVQNWEEGRHPPGFALMRALDEAWESATPEQKERFLGYLPPAERSQERRAVPMGEMGPAVSPGDLEHGAGAKGDISRIHEEVADWATWFGVRLAHLTTTVDQWRGELFGSDGLQALLHQELLMSDDGEPESGNNAHVLSRRKALAALAALPLALCTSIQQSLTSGATTELFIARCGASLTACWHLLRGSDLDTVDGMLSGYLLTLDALARQQSRYQQAAARLASQAHRISGILALHRSSLHARLRHYQQALYYAGLAADPSTEASSMLSLGYASYYAGDPERAARTYEGALAHERSIPPLLRARAYAELAKIHAEMQREQAALQAIALAEDLYPEHPEHDPTFLYAEFTPSSLILEKGLAYMALAEQAPGHGYEHAAWAIFEEIKRSSVWPPVPDRIRFEVMNHQAEAAVLLNDLDAFEVCLNRGLDGAALLKSHQRHREACVAWRRAMRVWPDEPRVKVLEDRLRSPVGG